MARSPSPSSSRRRRSRSPRRGDRRHERRRSASSSSSSSSRSESRRRRRRDDRHHHRDADKKRKGKRPEGVGKVETGEVERDRETKRAFERWVWKAKGKEVDRLEREKVKKYAAKFAKAWNKGRLDPEFYPTPKVDAAEPVAGPSLADVQFSRAEAQDSLAASRLASRAQAKRERREAKEEEVAERATGRDRLMEKRRERNEERRGYERERDEAGMEVDEATLMGGGAQSSFAAAVAARDRARERWQAKRLGADREERDAVAREAKQRVRQKEDDTMAMFKAMAASRFGHSDAS